MWHTVDAVNINTPPLLTFSGVSWAQTHNVRDKTVKLYKICLDIDYSRCQIPPDFVNKGGSEVDETER